jgi:hypothetical protein
VQKGKRKCVEKWKERRRWFDTETTKLIRNWQATAAESLMALPHGG